MKRLFLGPILLGLCFSVYAVSVSATCSNVTTGSGRVKTFVRAVAPDGCTLETKYSDNNLSNSANHTGTHSHVANGGSPNVVANASSSISVSPSSLSVFGAKKQTDNDATTADSSGDFSEVVTFLYDSSASIADRSGHVGFCSKYSTTSKNANSTGALTSLNFNGTGVSLSDGSIEGVMYLTVDGKDEVCKISRFTLPSGTGTRTLNVEVSMSARVNGNSTTVGHGVSTSDGNVSIYGFFSKPAAVTGCTSESSGVSNCEYVNSATEENLAQKQSILNDCNDAPMGIIDTASNGESGLVGNPINFLSGFKTQIETDYNSGGALSLIRFYRSDADWVSNSFGNRWWHNYERDLSVSGTSATLTDFQGVVTEFENDGNGNWSPVDPDVRTSFSGDGSGGYIYIARDNSREFYSSAGKLDKIMYLSGETLYFFYNGSTDFLELVSDEYGRSLTFHYNGSKIDYVLTPENTFYYTYTETPTDFIGGNLKTVVEDGASVDRVKTYHYENSSFPYALTQLDIDSTPYAHWNYDSQGRAIESAHYNGSSAAFDKDVYSILYGLGFSTVTNPLGKDTTYFYESYYGVRKVTYVKGHVSNNCAASNKSYSYDSNGWLVSKIDWEGNKVVFERNANGTINKRIEAANTTNERTTNYSYFTPAYLPNIYLPDVISEPGKLIDRNYDNYGRLTAYIVKDSVNTLDSRAWNFSYYSNQFDGNGKLTFLGRLETVTSPVSGIRKFFYNNDNLVSAVADLNAGNYGYTTQYTYDTQKRLDTITDENGVVTTLGYDDFGRVSTYATSYNGSTPITTTLSYDASDNLSAASLPNGMTFVYAYDTAHYLKSVKLGSGANQMLVERTRDEAGNITQEERKTSSSGAALYRIAMAYDELSRVIRFDTDRALGGSIDSAYYGYNKNSQINTITDENSIVTQYGYDPLNRLKTIAQDLNDADGNGSSNLQTVFSYNNLDDLTQVKNPKQSSTNYLYNVYGEVIEETNPDLKDNGGSNTIFYSYVIDTANDVTRVTRTDARGNDAIYTYDAFERLISITYPTNSANNVSLTYDTSTNPSSYGCSFGNNRLCTVTVGSGTGNEQITHYAYDMFGHVTISVETGSGLPGTFTKAYTYDDAGLLTGVLYPSGRGALFGRDINGNINDISALIHDGSNYVLTSVVYNADYLPFGPVSSYYLGDSGHLLSVSNSYNGAYELTNKTLVDGSTTVMNDTYVRDGAGMVTEINAISSFADWIFNFNALYFLSSEEKDGSTTTTYTHDAIGNRLTQNSNGTNTSYYYSGSTNILTGVNSASLSIEYGLTSTDQAGFSYTYDDVGRVSSVSNGSGTVATYAYNAKNQRTRKTTGGVTTYYIYGLGNKLYGEYDASGNLIREYVYFNDEPVAQIDNGTSSENISYIFTDHLGAPRTAYNTSGTKVWEWQHDSYGNGAPATFGSTPPTVNLRFAGQYYDAETGLFYNHNRYYDPSTGRYITSDPIGLGGGLNTFAYAGANPVMFTDPEGLNFVSTAGVKVAGKSLPPIRLMCNIYDAASLGSVAILRPDLLPEVIKENWQDIVFGDTIFNEKDRELTPEEVEHILNGDENGGGHRYGSDNNKSKFPNKPDEEVIKDIEDVLNDSNSVDTPARDGATRKQGTSKSGVPIDIIVDKDGGVLTAYPNWKR